MKNNIDDEISRGRLILTAFQPVSAYFMINGFGIPWILHLYLHLFVGIS